MGSYYRRSKIVLNAFRGFTSSRIFPLKSPIQQPGFASRNTLLGSSSILAPKSNTAKSSGFSSYSIIPWKKSVSHLTLRKQYYSPFHGCAKRYYHVDQYHHEVQHLKPSRPWFQNPRKVMISVLGGSGVLVTAYFRNLETIPYTKRTHLVLLSKSLERKFGDFVFKEMKNDDKYFKGKILPETHPKSVQVRSVSDHIIKALKDKGEGLNWEVVVVDKPKVCTACCGPGGKIVVYTGILKHFTSDAEIATIIGHEVGHAVARHSAELITNYFTKYMWLDILQFILNHLVKTHYVFNKMSNLLLKLPCSRRDEMEADYIGFLLMASAGYDPRVAPKVYHKFAELEDSSTTKNISAHPCGKMRAQLLAQPKVMKEALLIYSKRMREQSRTLGLKHIL